MEKITISKNISFCAGVQRTISLINTLLKEKKYKNIYMLGEVVHNEHVINELKTKGLKLIKNFNNIPKINDGIIIIQSHGVGKKIYTQLKNKNIKYIDSTCVLVKRIHNAVKLLEDQGYYPIIIGNKNHTEVQGIAGQVKKSIIINNKDDISKNLFKNINKIGVVFQSTFIKSKADKIIKKLKLKIKNVKIIDTICMPTKNRQSEIRDKAKKYNCVLIIGSKTSANTNHLFNISKKINKNTFFIEKPADVSKINFSKLKSYFVTSGASTPEHIISETIDEINKIINDYYKFSKKYIPIIDKTISNFFNEKWKKAKIRYTKELISDLKEYCLRPGKRIRPLLVLLVYKGFSNKNKKTIPKDIIKLAVSIELMHSFLLIHDDIMDKADLRRGRKSFHIICREKFKSLTYNSDIGEDIAMVVGDILFADVIGIIAQSTLTPKIKDKFLKIFSECYKLTGWGQILDTLSSKLKKLEIDSKIPMQISEYKTAYYTIYFPMLIGYILAGKNNKETIKTIKNFALPLGIAFQIKDDLLGIFGDKFKTGKSDISDIIEGKYTLLINTTLQYLKGKNKNEFIKLFIKKEKTLKDIKNIKKIINQSGAFKKNKNDMKKEFNKSLMHLKDLIINKNEKHILFDLITVLKNF